MNKPLPKSVSPSVSSRGQMLYENHCMACHDSVVHIRGNRRTQSLPEFQARVLHWAAYLQLRWGNEEVEDVVSHLISWYYTFNPARG